MPDAGDPSWPTTAKPLLLHLSKSRFGLTILEIVEWAREWGYAGNKVRHMLAWLSLAGKVAYDSELRVWKVVTTRDLNLVGGS